MKLTRRQSFTANLLYAGAQEVTQKTGMEEPKPKTRRDNPEGRTLNAIMDMLRHHPRVAWRARVNSGAYKTPDGRFIRFGFPGCPDILGQLKDGRILMIEVKSESGRMTEDQKAVIENIVRHNGRAGVARSVDDAIRIVEGS